MNTNVNEKKLYSLDRKNDKHSENIHIKYEKMKCREDIASKRNNLREGNRVSLDHQKYLM